MSQYRASGFDFESAARLVLYEPHKVGDKQLRLTPRLASERCRWLGGTIPPLEKDKAVHLEFLRPSAHLVGKYSTTVARFRRPDRRRDGAVDLFASFSAGISQNRQ
jgi:hypothetical protein